MARLIMGDSVSTGGISVPGQLSALGNIVLHANAAGHLDRINNFAPEHQIRFGILDYVTNARGDLVLTNFSASLEALEVPKAYTLGALADPASRPALTLRLALSPDASDVSKNPESTCSYSTTLP